MELLYLNEIFAFLGVAKSCCIVKYLGSSCNVPGEEPITASKKTRKNQEPFRWNTWKIFDKYLFFLLMFSSEYQERAGWFEIFKVGDAHHTNI